MSSQSGFSEYKGDNWNSIFVMIVPASQLVTKLAKRKGVLFISPLKTSTELYVELWHNFNLEEKVYPLQVWQDLVPLS